MFYVVGRVTGVTCLDNIMYVVCCLFPSTIRRYSTDTYSPLDLVIYVNGMRRPQDIVVCRHDRQLYVADIDCIWRVSVDSHTYLKWLTTKSSTDTFTITSLSLTSRHLLVTSSQPSPALRQYDTTDTQLLRVVEMPGYVQELYHGIETKRSTFIIEHCGTLQSHWQSAVSELFRLCHCSHCIIS